MSNGTWTYTWEKGRQLKQISDANTTITFDYNADGLRVRKTVNNVVTNYILHGKNIVHLTQGSDNLHFYYDAQNRPAIVDYNGILYRYIYNLQGDVLGLLDGNNTEVVQYTYDAWGKILSVTGTLASTVGTIQPFRYRGYVYDVETGLYYLRSRYYNPTWSRCANADDLIVGNLYCYCNCNPIGRIDTSGHWDYSAYKEKVVESWFEFLREVIVYSIKSVNNPRVYTVSTFLQKCRDTADAHNLKYTNKSCAAAIAHHLEFGMSETGMTSMMRNDIIVAIEIANPEHGILLGVPQKALIPGAILMQIDWKDPDGRPANHGGIVAEDLNAYQSSPSSKVFCHQDLYTQPWTHMGWHKGVRLDDWVIVLCEAIWPGLKELEGNK